MLRAKCVIITLFCLSISYMASAQRSAKGKSVYTKTRHTSSFRMSRAKSRIVCPVFETSGYPYHGIGIKVGDPFAVTYKFYANKKFSIVADVGKSASGLYSSYYKDIFMNFFPDTLNQETGVEYLSHKVKKDFVTEIKLLYNFDASIISKGLQVYTGVGFEWRSTQIKYDFLVNNNSPDPSEPENKFATFTGNRSTYGVQGTLGIEYSYFQLPVSAFMELEVFTDLQKDPGYYRVQGGVGIRYVF